MIRTGEQYRDGLRDGREVWIDGERVKDVSGHPSLKPIIDIRARMYDMQHDNEHAPVLTYQENGDSHSIFNRLPKVQQDWHDKWKAVDTVWKKNRLVNKWMPRSSSQAVPVLRTPITAAIAPIGSRRASPSKSRRGS